MLADGTTFEGEAIGAEPPSGVATGEVVFNTVLSGYQEVITDPSYAGQIITFTYPHIGNYGVTPADDESAAARSAGAWSSATWPGAAATGAAEADLDAFLRRHGVPGIAGIDTRRLTRHIRDAGAMPGAFGTADETTLKQAAAERAGHRRRRPGRPRSRCTEPYTVGDGPAAGSWPTTSASSARSCATSAAWPPSRSCPPRPPADEVLAREPDGVFLSNGPGDPAAVPYADRGHRGPARPGARSSASASATSCWPRPSAATTVQAARSATTAATTRCSAWPPAASRSPARTTTTPSPPTRWRAAEVTHVNLNDGVIEGLRCLDVPAFSVQYHPEAGPGPHDARYLFDDCSPT